MSLTYSKRKTWEKISEVVEHFTVCLQMIKENLLIRAPSWLDLIKEYLKFDQIKVKMYLTTVLSRQVTA